jgi:hypothetical protein
MELVIQPGAITSSIVSTVLVALPSLYRAIPIDPRAMKEKHQMNERTVHQQSSSLDVFFVSSCLVVGATLPTATRHPRCGGVMQDKGTGSLLVSV